MLRLGIISDIHCHEKSEKPQGGYYFPLMPDYPVSQNPFASLRQLARSDGIEVDFLLCPGDYAHIVDEKGLKSSWEQLKLMSHELKAKFLIGTIGNHDVASRAKGDSFSYLKIFDSNFPVYVDTKSPEYLKSLLNEGYYYVDNEEDDIFFMVLNSCFDHWDEIQASRGKILKEESEKIEKIIENSSRSKKILMVHHHPIIHETGISDTGDVIEGSEELMKNVAKAKVDLVIHGHKHDFRFTQETIYPRNLNILASGSFACYKSSLKTYVQNAFHVVEFHSLVNLDQCINPGIIKTYLYDPAHGWELDPSKEEGFGCVLTEPQLIGIVKPELVANALPYVLWDELISRIPVLKYISRKTRNNILKELLRVKDIQDLSLDRFGNVHSYIIIR
jgi:predicted phosphodiesterase